MRFVVHYHRVSEGSDAAASHYDLMLEHGGRLLTWALPVRPLSGDTHGSCSARRLADHRVHYLDYEGELSEGRGKVQRLLAGQLEWISFDPAAGDFRARLSCGETTWLLEIIESAGSRPASEVAVRWFRDLPNNRIAADF